MNYNEKLHGKMFIVARMFILQISEHGKITRLVDLIWHIAKKKG